MTGSTMLQSAFECLDGGAFGCPTRLDDADVGYDIGVCAALLEDQILSWVTAGCEGSPADYLFDLFSLYVQALDLNGLSGVERAWRHSHSS